MNIVNGVNMSVSRAKDWFRQAECVPFEYFTSEQASDAVASAEKILLHIKGYFSE